MTQKLIYLTCPFEDEGECKSMGGQWDPSSKCWYIRSSMNLDKFAKWLPLPDYPLQIEKTLARLENSLSLKILKSKIEHFDIYPPYLKTLMLNCLENYEFGDCLGYMAPNDNAKYVQEHIDDFFVEASVNLDVAIDNLHKKIILILKSKVSELKE